MLATNILRIHAEDNPVTLPQESERNSTDLLEVIDSLNILIQRQELLRMALEECKTDNRVSLLLDIYIDFSDNSLEHISCLLEKIGGKGR